MLEAIEQLLVLQERDRRIRTLKQEIKLAPQEQASLEGRLATGSATLTSAKLRAKEIEVEKKNLELQAQAKRDSILKFKTQQFQTRKNEEFQALSNEIKRYEGDIQTIEDRELDVMEEAEKARVATAAGEKELGQLKSSVERQLADLAQKTRTIETQLQELEKERADLASRVEEDLLTRYERLFASKGDAAVVALDHEVCMGCHMKITTQTAVRVKSDREIMNCDQCGRILYYEG